MDGGEVILVAVDASKEITDYALEWAVGNVIKAMDSLVLLAVIPSRDCLPAAVNQTHQCQIYQFLSHLLKKKGVEHNQKKDCVDTYDTGIMPQRIKSVCTDMIQQLFSAYNVVQATFQVKVVVDARMGSVAVAADELGATWVILDRRLKKEGDSCLKQLLNCNIILIDHAIPKILRSIKVATPKKIPIVGCDPTVGDMLGMLNPTYNSDTPTTSINSPWIHHLHSNSSSNISFLSSSTEKDQFHKASPSRTKLSPPMPNTSSPLLHYPIFGPQVETETPPHIYTSPYRKSPPLHKLSKFGNDESPRKSTASSLDQEKTKGYKNPMKAKNDGVKATQAASFSPRKSTADSSHSWKTLKIPNQSRDSRARREAMSPPSPTILNRTSSIRRDMSLSIKQPPTPPPLCSICKHNAPVFGKAPRRFSYKEIERATNGFSRNNFLAEGGYGAVYRGVLPDGLVVAVKQRKMLSAQGASEFCSEVEVLSCAQHRNLVMLVGYCIEIEWLLVYEFACNGSLDKHLYGRETNEVMIWHNRMKVAIGAARGLRYLHEDCRVGCIVHRDLRPTNILLTHDFEPMLGDFGLARWQADGQSAEETRVIGAFGYLAPEYTQAGLITEKTDVYAFGVVLLELLTGTKATEFSRKGGQEYLPDWSLVVSVKRKKCIEIIDPQLENNYIQKEAECMMQAAILCLSSHPQQRPRMSKVLKILEGDVPYHDGQSNSFCQGQSLNNYSTPETLWSQNLDNSPSNQMQLINHMNTSPSRHKACVKNEQNNIFKQTKLSEEQLVNEEYQEYLHGTLSKFIQNLTVK